ncbi:MAG: aromatic ring-hydroxylating dioxygenase subunit alpha [Alphaproteobacteria bacterium]|nr:aromatic ring-hydroxylating dioxygenase subunit alpha [Alphaproteobacteria bacterium]
MYPIDLFDPRHYANVRKPVMQAESLPAWCYTSETFYAREVERIFKRTWTFVDRVDRIPEPGDYLVFDYVGISTIIVRGKDRKVRAFANTCRHRGSAVMAGEGNCKAMRCPYHSWTYGLDGSLIATPYMNLTENFDPGAYSLAPIRLEVWGGFVFINFDANAESLRSYLGDLVDNTEGYRFDDMVCARRLTYEIAANWKLFYENFAEQYHIPFIHKTSLYKQKRKINPPEKTDGNYVALYVEHPGSRMLLAGDTGFPPIKGLEGRIAKGTYYPNIHPSTVMGCCVDGMWFVRSDPLGPERTRLVVGTCFPRATLERRDFAKVAKRYYKRLDTTIPEDIKAAEDQQAGLRSPYYRPGRLSYLEQLVHSIDNWVLDRVLDRAA